MGEHPNIQSRGVKCLVLHLGNVYIKADKGLPFLYCLRDELKGENLRVPEIIIGNRSLLAVCDQPNHPFIAAQRFHQLIFIVKKFVQQHLDPPLFLFHFLRLFGRILLSILNNLLQGLVHLDV